MILGGLYLASFAGYLLFHTLVELYSIVIAFAIFIVTWNTRRFLYNDCLNVIGIGYAFSACLDLLHTLAYKDLNLLAGFEVQLTVQFWIAARYMQAATLFVAPIFLKRQINTNVLILIYIAAFWTMVAIIFSGYFPDCFIDGQGLTQFKIISEYIVIAVCAMSMFLFFKNRSRIQDIYILIIISIACTMAAEMTFTAWKSMYDSIHMLGHFFKLAAFYLIYRALLYTCLQQPLDIIFKDMRQTELTLRSRQNTLEENIRERTSSLESMNKKLEQEIRERMIVEDQLRQSEHNKIIQTQIANVFLTIPDEEMYREVLAIVLHALKSKFGIFGFIAPNGDLVIPSLTREIWNECQVSSKSIVFPQDQWGDSLWGKAIREKKAQYSDGPFHIPEGHVKIDTFLTAPILFGNNTIGLISVANRERSYTEEDKLLLESITAYISPILNARLQRDRHEKEEERIKIALQQSNDLLRAIVESTPVAIIGLDLDGKVQMVWNPTAERMLGWSAKEAMGQFLPSVPVENREEFSRFRALIRSGKTLNGIDVRRQKRDGTPIDYSIYAYPLHDTQGRISGNIAVLVDITERKRAEEALRKLSQAVEQSPVSIVITDVTGKIEFVNITFTHITGYTHEEVIGQNIRILHSETPDEDYSRLWKTISSGGVWRGEFHNRKKSGELFWEHAIIAPIRNAENIISHYVAVKEDITELKKLEEQLRHSQKMEAIGQLAGGVAHDFNNMLGVIIGYAELAMEKAALDDSLCKDIEEIRTAAFRSAEITRQLLAFARKQTIVPKVINLNDSIANMLKLLRRLIGEDIELAWLPGENLWQIKMDQSQIDQILVNLCVNARDAIAGVGKITIETQKANFDAYCTEQKGLSPGEYVILIVSDNGCGMDKQTLDKLFEPFFTTKGIGKGTGLGLATVYGIVKQNAGFINVYSEVGRGSTFKIYLPRYTAIPTEEPTPMLDLTDLRGHETILVVEDEPLHLRMVKLMLEGYGYHVFAASTPKEALDIAKDYSSIRLLLSDVIMPEMNGRDLAKAISFLYPNIICLFMSGYTDNVIAHHGLLDQGINFIQKPFSKQELAAKIRELLDSKSSHKMK